MTLILALALVGAALWAVFAFNRLVRLRNQVRAGWSDIDVQLMRRHDLIPNLVEAVRAYASHEKNAFERVTALRTEALGTRSPAQLADIEAELEGMGAEVPAEGVDDVELALGVAAEGSGADRIFVVGSDGEVRREARVLVERLDPGCDGIVR